MEQFLNYNNYYYYYYYNYLNYYTPKTLSRPCFLQLRPLLKLLLKFQISFINDFFCMNINTYANIITNQLIKKVFEGEILHFKIISLSDSNGGYISKCVLVPPTETGKTWHLIYCIYCTAYDCKPTDFRHIWKFNMLTKSISVSSGFPVPVYVDAINWCLALDTKTEWIFYLLHVLSVV